MNIFSRKKIPAICLVLAAASALIWSLPEIAAGNSGHISTARILEFTLQNLKESLERTKQKNDRLSFENSALRKDIKYLQGILGNFDSRKQELLGGEKMPSVVRNPYAIAESYDADERRERTEQLIELFRKDVLRLSEEMHLLDRQVEESSYAGQREQLLSRKAQSEQYIHQAEKKIRALKRKLKRPQMELEQLTEDNEILKEQLDILKDKFIDEKYPIAQEESVNLGDVMIMDEARQD